MMQLGMNSSWTTLTTMSGWPASTAASTANSAASGSKSTASVASMIGRLSAGTGGRSWRCCWRRTVNMSLGMKLPARGTRRRAPDVAPPKRHVEEDPEEGHRRSEKDEPAADEDDERDQHRPHRESEGEHVQPEASHPAEQALVLLHRDLLGVPAPAAALAGPALAVRDVLRLAAVTGDRDRRPFHRERL